MLAMNASTSGRRSRRVAVLGAGIMGSSTALMLARAGAEVTLFDAADRPFSAASRWNEGKIHLGFMYNADPSLKTLHQLLPGGLLFKSLTEDLIGCSLSGAITSADDVYLCHARSVVPAAAMSEYFRQVAQVLREHPDSKRYLIDVSNCRVTRLTASELKSITGSPDIVAGFRAPERSVSTTWIGDRFVEALSAESRIEQRMNTTVTAIHSASAQDIFGPRYVDTDRARHGPYDWIVNSLWQGRIAIDATAGLQPAGVWSNRYRLSLFIRTSRPLRLANAVITTGPFGDIKNYNDRDFYLSWYPLGLMADSSAVSPPAQPQLDDSRKQEICSSVIDKLEEFMPAVGELRQNISQMDLQGGWVFAAGQGQLSDPNSTLHRRSDFGVVQSGSYISVDTGKYSTAPWLARKIADSIR